MTTDIRERAEVALLKLGEAPGEIATALHRRGIKGTRSALSCPLAKYLTAELGVETAVGFTVAVIGIVGPPKNRMIVSLTNAQVTFVADFDTGRHPQLIADPLVAGVGV